MDRKQTTTETAATLRQFVEQTKLDFEQTENDLREVSILIQQSTGEVEKLAMRNAEVANRLHHIEANLDTVPRDDIRDAYTSSQEAQVRLFLMRGQLEQLQSRQQLLQHHRDTLRVVLDAAERMTASGVEIGGNRAEGGGASLIAHIVNAQETERQRLARAMHDGPAQSLTNLILQAQICEKLFDHDPVQARAELQNLKEAANGAFRRVRDFIFDLRPMMLDDLGLYPTIRRYVQDFEAKTGLTCTLNLAGKEQRLPPYIEVTVFRVIQGLLDNVRQHAHANRVTVNVNVAPNSELNVMVEDDGAGFDVVDVMAQARQRKTMGLITIMEQAEMAGGDLKFDSSPGRGTRVQMRLPL